MSGRKNSTVTILLVVAVSLITTTLTVLFMSKYHEDIQFQMIGGICQMLTEADAVDTDALLKAVKGNRDRVQVSSAKNFLESYGYKSSDFTDNRWEFGYLIAAICFCVGILVFLWSFRYWKKKECERIQGLTDYLERVNMGGQEILLEAEEDDHSRLQDEIYKTVTTLYHTRDAALTAKSNFADNLYNIAHQLKTPITAISLSAQMMEEKFVSEYPRQIQKQVARLTHLEEALLLLSRIDAGTLPFEKTSIDVFTLLELAADHLQEHFVRSGVAIDIPEVSPGGDSSVRVLADMEWTMEAIMNLLKNCMEHSPAGTTVHCSYSQNPLYVQIRIWDEGPGFEKEDIPHLFERFYRGQNAVRGGIGIGLSLSKAIIEMQNGIIRAGNLNEGGAYFEVRMYSH